MMGDGGLHGDDHDQPCQDIREVVSSCDIEGDRKFTRFLWLSEPLNPNNKFVAY